MTLLLTMYLKRKELGCVAPLLGSWCRVFLCLPDTKGWRNVHSNMSVYICGVSITFMLNLVLYSLSNRLMDSQNNVYILSKPQDASIQQIDK